MTVGEIWAVIWARTRGSDQVEDLNAQMYDELIQLKEQEQESTE